MIVRLCDSCKYGETEPNHCKACKVVTIEDLAAENAKLRDLLEQCLNCLSPDRHEELVGEIEQAIGPMPGGES